MFACAHWYVVLPLMCLMTLIAGISAAGHGRRTYTGQLFDSVVSVWSGSWLVTAIGLFVILRIHPGTNRSTPFRFWG